MPVTVIRGWRNLCFLALFGQIMLRQSVPWCSRCRSGGKQLPTECIFYFGGPE
jgi:hypothetical protein